jgi:Rps23 Pro-64 3,4-dihydroxylase Tpa1-like proline 4-hydroxylase
MTGSPAGRIIDVPLRVEERADLNREVVNFARLEQLLRDGGSAKYRTNSPFPHISIEGVLPERIAEQAYLEIESTDVPQEKVNYSTFLKHRLSDRERIGPIVGAVIDALNSDRFLRFLEQLTGIGRLIADPALEGGGIHRIGTGGFLKVHTDFNFHRIAGLFRRLNILIYFNPDWKEEWGGAIELWDRDMSRCVAGYAPLWNRAVIFSTTDESFHGHPDPLNTPEGKFRNSIALYYYTKEAPAEGYRFKQSELTNYQARPGESFGAGILAHAIHQAEIRHSWLRKVTKPLKSLFG